MSYQFLFQKQDRTDAAEIDCVDDWWRDLTIPTAYQKYPDESKAIARVEVMYRKFDSLMMGLKFESS